MKNPVNKGFITYLLLFVGIILGVVLISCTILIFSPGTAVFGYVYNKENTKTIIRNYDGQDQLLSGEAQSTILDIEGNVAMPVINPTLINFSSLSKIVVITNNIDVNFIHGEEDRIDVIRNFYGFVKEENYSQLTLTKKYNFLTQTLEIVVNNQELNLTVSSVCQINVLIKNQTPFLQVEVDGENAPVTFADKAFSNEVTTDLTVKSLKINTNKSNILIGEQAKIDEFVDMEVESGNIEFKSNLKASETEPLSYVKLNLENGNIIIDDMYAYDIYFIGEITYIKSVQIYGDINFSVVNGQFSSNFIFGDFLDDANIATGVDINIKQLFGEITLPANEKGDVTIDEITGTAYIRSTSGNINLKDAQDIVNIESTSGQINVFANSDESVNITSLSGQIKIMFANVANTKNISSTDGNITLFYVQSLIFKIVATSQNKISFPNENLSYINQTVWAFPTTQSPLISTTKIVNLTSQRGEITINPVSQINWNLVH